MAPLQNPLGNPIPAFTEHAISVSLPTWADNVGYEEGDARVLNAMQSGYPRFFINLNIKKVSDRILLARRPWHPPPSVTLLRSSSANCFHDVAPSYPPSWNKSSAHPPRAPSSSPPANLPRHAAHS